MCIKAYVYIYMVIDLKVPVRIFNCESRACYVGNPRESFFRVRESNIFFAKVSRKLGIIIIMYRVATHCHPGSGRRRALENFGLVLVQFPVWWCLWTITPFIGSSRASKGEASRQPTPWSRSVNRDIFAKVPRKLCERAGESQSAC